MYAVSCIAFHILKLLITCEAFSISYIVLCSIKKDLFLFIYVSLCECMPHVCRYLRRPEVGIASPGAGVTGL